MNASEAAGRFAVLFHHIYVRFHQRARPTDPRVSPESLAVLRHLSASGPLTVAEACRHFERSQAATSELFARLERRGLVERFCDERDRRRTLIWLTEDGRDVLERSTSVLSSYLLEDAFAKLPTRDRERLVIGMETLLATDRAKSPYPEDEP